MPPAWLSSPADRGWRAPPPVASVRLAGIGKVRRPRRIREGADEVCVAENGGLVPLQVRLLDAGGDHVEQGGDGLVEAPARVKGERLEDGQRRGIREFRPCTLEDRRGSLELAEIAAGCCSTIGNSASTVGCMSFRSRVSKILSSSSSSVIAPVSGTNPGIPRLGAEGVADTSP